MCLYIDRQVWKRYRKRDQWNGDCPSGNFHCVPSTPATGLGHIARLLSSPGVLPMCRYYYRAFGPLLHVPDADLVT